MDNAEQDAVTKSSVKIKVENGKYLMGYWEHRFNLNWWGPIRIPCNSLAFMKKL